MPHDALRAVANRRPPGSDSAMTKKPVAQDNRTLVDRGLDRVKNNRFAAAIIIIGICLAAIASFTESLSKLSEVLPILSKPEIEGEWKSEPIDLYGAGPQVMILKFTEAVGGRLVGNVRFFDLEGNARTPELDVLEGKREGNTLTFSFDGGARTYSPSGPLVPLRESVYGEVSDNEIQFVYQREGHGAVSFASRRKAQGSRGG